MQHHCCSERMLYGYLRRRTQEKLLLVYQTRIATSAHLLSTLSWTTPISMLVHARSRALTARFVGRCPHVLSTSHCILTLRLRFRHARSVLEVES